MLPPEERGYAVVGVAATFLLLAVRLCAPALYRVHSTALVVGIRLLFCLVFHGVDFARAVGVLEAVESGSPGVSLAHFWFAMLCSSAALQMVLLLSTPLPPVANAGMTVVSLGIIASANPKLCASLFAVHPITERRLEGLVGLLGPLAAAVEWPLVALGVPHAALPCHTGSRSCPPPALRAWAWAAAVVRHCCPPSAPSA